MKTHSFVIITVKVLEYLTAFEYFAGQQSKSLENHCSKFLSLQDFHHIKGYYWQVAMCMSKGEMHMAAHTTKGQMGSSHINSVQQNYVINSSPGALFHSND